jgi:heme/copper-type cytochrome/quinol oxidase subunit 2
MELSVRRICVAAAVVAAVMLPEMVRACAVCYGNPESDMAKGAAAGVLVLMGIIVSVLAGIVGVTVFWMRRARRYRNARAQYISERRTGFPGMNGKWLAADAE